MLCPEDPLAHAAAQFLKGRVRTVALSESSRADVIASMNTFLRPHSIFQVTRAWRGAPLMAKRVGRAQQLTPPRCVCRAQVMIVSYETFRIHADKFTKEGSCDLLICDEAHRLKNSATQTTKVCTNPNLSTRNSPFLAAWC